MAGKRPVGDEEVVGAGPSKRPNLDEDEVGRSGFGNRGEDEKSSIKQVILKPYN